jgi:trimeric autotransporter adhesin
MKFHIAPVMVALLLFPALNPSTAAQTPTQASAQTASALPRLVRFSGTVKDLNGSPLTGVVGITFAFYSEQTGGAPLWLETQNATADSAGHYTVLLGSTKPEGLPAELFTSEQARWVGVQVSGQPEQPRVLLVSAPYALKAGDAETIGGLPPSAFVLAAPPAINSSTPSGTTETVTPLVATDVTTTGGSADYLPIFSGAATIIDSSVFQIGSGTTGKIGIDTITPATQLDVNGAGTIRGTLSLPAAGTATATAGDVSQGLNFVASSYDSTSATAVNQTFRWHAEPAGNDTTAPSGTLNLQYGLGTAAPTETGLKISSKGIFTFATGQTFPGAGGLTGITTAAGSGLSGGGTTGTLSLKVPAAGITNAMLADSKITLNNNTAGGLTTPGAMTLGGTYAIGIKPCAASQILQYSGTTWNCVAPTGTGTITGVTAGTALTGGGTGGKVTLNLDTTKVPLLSSANSFAGSMSLSVSNTGAIGPTLTLTNPGGDNTSTFTDGAAAIDFNTTAISTSGTYNPGARIEAVDDGVHSTDINFLSNIYGGGSGAANNGLQTNMTVFGASGMVSIGTTEAQAQLEVIGSTNEGVWAFGGSESDFGISQGLNGLRAGGGASTGTDDGGIGAWLFGGDVSDGGTGTTGEGLLVWTGDAGGNGTVGLAADFEGDVFVDGTLSADVKDFKIDHPLDPANKYLVHASVESSEMMNIYSGNVTTDELGLATVTLPDWFQAENTDFRYQLTVVDERFAQAVISKRIENNQFTIHTNATNVQVSWQITAVRQDAYAKAHPMVVEPVKGAKERGFYQHPELYGQPKEKQTQWGLNPVMVQKMIAEKKKLNENALNKAKKINGNPQTRLSTGPVSHAQLN